MTDNRLTAEQIAELQKPSGRSNFRPLECCNRKCNSPDGFRCSREKGHDGPCDAHFFARQLERDQVNHPPHYTAHPSGIECITVVEHMNFCVGNAIKYLWRADEKGNAIEDLKKAIWYIEREIARREKK